MWRIYILSTIPASGNFLYVFLATMYTCHYFPVVNFRQKKFQLNLIFPQIATWCNSLFSLIEAPGA